MSATIQEGEHTVDRKGNKYVYTRYGWCNVKTGKFDEPSSFKPGDLARDQDGVVHLYTQAGWYSLKTLTRSNPVRPVPIKEVKSPQVSAASFPPGQFLWTEDQVYLKLNDSFTNVITGTRFTDAVYKSFTVRGIGTYTTKES